MLSSTLGIVTQGTLADGTTKFDWVEISVKFWLDSVIELPADIWTLQEKALSKIATNAYDWDFTLKVAGWGGRCELYS